mmetsp:Transcript_71374/g.155034  ORF Transcript_71374/g.155034 Transcript_71374/m.155034 type:complete len:96 (+) Transcript_71374:480-767(+)
MTRGQASRGLLSEEPMEAPSCGGVPSRKVLAEPVLEKAARDMASQGPGSLEHPPRSLYQALQALLQATSSRDGMPGLRVVRGQQSRTHPNRLPTR